MTGLDLLRAARARIEQPEHWTQGEYARDAKGEGVNIHSPTAVCWCLTGALIREVNVDYAQALQHARIRLFELGGHSLSYLNDTFDHAAVLKLFDDAIDAESQRSE